jgi:hypothetical protein
VSTFPTSRQHLVGHVQTERTPQTTNSRKNIRMSDRFSVPSQANTLPNHTNTNTDQHSFNWPTILTLANYTNTSQLY